MTKVQTLSMGEKVMLLVLLPRDIVLNPSYITFIIIFSVFNYLGGVFWYNHFTFRIYDTSKDFLTNAL